MGMYVTHRNVEVAAEILDLLAEKECTITDANSILSYVSSKLNRTAKVPKCDYYAQISKELELNEEDD